MKFSIIIIPALLIVCLLSSCSNPGTPNPNQTAPLKAAHVNPFAPGTYAHFRAQKGYPRNYGVWRNEAVLARTNASNSSIRIDLSAQRGYLMNGTELAMDYPVATGRGKYPTPKGNFRILEKIKSDKRSSTYGRIYDAEGKLVKSDADSRKDPIPEGGKYVGAAMPYWMRITWDGVGMHKGNVPRYPASHGCIRTYYKVVATVYSKVRVGTRVTIVP
ncbi:MAG: L,D-transpeptidase [Akkermansiaceae bacterium]|nr:L,D-transpeptidase [Akkermansiaceae bacterium]